MDGVLVRKEAYFEEFLYKPYNYNMSIVRLLQQNIKIGNRVVISSKNGLYTDPKLMEGFVTKILKIDNYKILNEKEEIKNY